MSVTERRVVLIRMREAGIKQNSRRERVFSLVFVPPEGLTRFTVPLLLATRLSVHQPTDAQARRGRRSSTAEVDGDPDCCRRDAGRGRDPLASDRDLGLYDAHLTDANRLPDAARCRGLHKGSVGSDQGVAR
jgi:hypothetical protein